MLKFLPLVEAPEALVVPHAPRALTLGTPSARGIGAGTANPTNTVDASGAEYI